LDVILPFFLFNAKRPEILTLFARLPIQAQTGSGAPIAHMLEQLMIGYIESNIPGYVSKI
jgi:hypothetical protein